MATTLNAGTSTTGAAISADTSGILQLQSGSTPTTAVTINASQVASFTNNLGTVAGYPAYQCRAWANFDGTGTVAIRASGNVSSITKNGTGDYTINFTTAMPDANYTPVCFGNRANTVTAPRIPLIRTDGTVPTTSALRVEMVDTSSTGTTDQAYINIAIFR